MEYHKTRREFFEAKRSSKYIYSHMLIIQKLLISLFHQKVYLSEYRKYTLYKIFLKNIVIQLKKSLKNLLCCDMIQIIINKKEEF